MKLLVAKIPSYSSITKQIIQLTMSAAVGASYVLVVGSELKVYNYQPVNQPRCHTAHRRDKIAGFEARQCRSCGEHHDQTAFASKGRCRTSRLCKDCDNQRRRAAHASSAAVVRWDNPVISLESAEVGADKLAALLWEILSDHSSSRAQPLEQTIDSLLNRRSGINDFVNEVQNEG